MVHLMMDSEIGRQIKEEAAELLTEMEAALLELEDRPEEPSLINRVFRAMHTIKGAANMFGLNDIAGLTHEVETVYDKVRSGILPCTPILLDLSFKAKDLIWELIETPDEVDSEALANVKGGLNAVLCGEPPAKQSAPYSEEPLAPEFVESENFSVSYAVSFTPSEEGILVRSNPLDVLDELRNLGECRVIPRTNAVPELPLVEPDSCALSWDILVTTDKGMDAVRDVFIFVEDCCAVDVREVDDPAAWIEEHAATVVPASPASLARSDVPARKAETPIFTPSMPTPAVKPIKAPKTPPSPSMTCPEKTQPDSPKKVRRDSHASVRVDAFKLDDMVALVGELVIAQAKLSQIAGNIANPSLLAVSEEIELLSGSLRDRTLSMRMLPIGTTFDRFRRLVRDLSHELGKEIELVTQGAETELDKTVIEQLGDPLVHLLRNSIDHGIELPEERRAAGKPAKGTLVLSAEHSGGHVLIKIFDNGKGLDRDKIAAKGLERGLITDPESMTDKEIFNLIFHPGFSTADTVTSVSGRGVGMDVVKRGIETLRGSVDIDSTKGVGTTVIVKLPLTLAIIEGLQVRVAEEYFVIPLSAVQECVELSSQERSDTDNAHKRIVNLRNEIVPYIRLREWFEVEGETPEIEQIIIVGDDNVRTGIVVDEVIGQQQTVIKSLGKVFKNVEEFSGATIKGDGTMALILDVPHLVRKVMAACAESRRC